MSFLFGAKKREEHSFLICCIESGAIHVALVLAYPKNKPFIVHSVSKAIPFQETLSHERLTTTTLQAIVDACDEVVTKGISHISSRKLKHRHLDRIYCVYGSPWYISQTQTVTIEKEKPVVLTQKILHELVEQYASADTLGKILDSEKDIPFILEQSVTGIRLNGYPVTNPTGKEARQISFSVSSGAISNQFRLYIEESISRFFSNTPFTHHCAPTMEFFGVRDTLATEDTFLIIDVSAEITDVTLVHQGILKETASFPYGTRSALRSFALSAQVLQSEVLGVLRSLNENKLDSTVSKKYTEATKKAQGEWKALFEKTLFEIEQGGAIPTSAFVLGESADFMTLQKLFIPVQELVNPRSQSKIATTTLLGDALKPFCLVREGVRLSHPLLVFSALYVHKTLAVSPDKKGVQ